MTDAKTSHTHPIRIDWLTTPWTGKLGLTFAPGKKDLDARSGPWERDLETDIQRLRDEYEVEYLVCLVEDHELEMLRIQRLADVAEQAGIALHRLPIVDLDIPDDASAVAQLVSSIVDWASAGSNVVIHCRGGLGRSGLIGGCVLRAAGFDGATALAELSAARSPNCPETNEQRRYVERFELTPRTRHE